MPVALSTLLTFAAAAVAEIAGCFAFWAWLRQGCWPPRSSCSHRGGRDHQRRL